MGQRRLSKPKDDNASKKPASAQQTRKKTGNGVLDATHTRRGEVFRAQRRTSENVNARASQHIIDIPVNKSVYNGYDGEQYSLAQARRQKPDNRPALKVIPIGGLGEMGIGKNMAAIEYDNDILIIDMGFLFPNGEDYPGINYITPDVTYLEERKNRVRGIVFTHGHLDHIGAARHILPKFPGVPVYASKFTLGMVQRMMEEATEEYNGDWRALNPENHDRVNVCDSFSIELVRVNHSIPDSTAVVVRTPLGVIVDTGDWRFEDRPLDGKKFDLERLTEIASKEGILMLMNESTNCESEGSHSYGELDIKESFGQVMDKYANSRIIISAFSSQLHRIQAAIEQAGEHGRKVAVAGYSMIQNIEVALRTGEIKLPKDTLVKVEDLVKLPDSKFVLICTGSQGEFNAVLNRMATGAHKYIKTKGSDVVVFSSNPIPGNEPFVVRTVDGLMREGSDVLQNGKTKQYEIGPLHLSGHGYYDDHVKLINALNPKFYMPIHGEFHMLVKNAELAEEACGLKRNQIFVCDAGDVVSIYDDSSARKTGRIPVGGVMYDDSGAIVSEVVLKDRIHMSNEGIFTVVLTVQKGTGRLLSSPDIISRGFIYLRDSEELVGLIRQYLKQKIARSYASRRVDLDELKKELKEEVTLILFDQTKRTPIVIPVINEIAAGGKFNAGSTGGGAGNTENAKRSSSKSQSPSNKKSEAERKAEFAKKAAALNQKFAGAQNPGHAQITDPSQISFKRRPQGPSAGGLRDWR